MSAEAPFYYDPGQAAIAIGYKNNAFIADKVLPRIQTGTSQKYSWRRYRLNEVFSIPDTEVGRTGRPNEIEFGYDEIESRTRDYGLEDPIPQSDIDNAAGANAISPVNTATQMLSELVMLDRERRVANLVQNLNIYPSSQRVTLSGTSQLSDYSNSDPIGIIEEAMLVPIRRPNVMVISEEGFSKLSRHPKIVQAFNANEGGSGIATINFIATLFRLDEVVIGQAWYNAARRGQNPTLSRIWGKHISLIRQEPVQLPYTMTFGFTAMTGSKIAGQRPDPNIGLKGGVRIRVGEQIEENISGPEFGYFIQNAFA
jgi:hypothetical protein